MIRIVSRRLRVVVSAAALAVAGGGSYGLVEALAAGGQPEAMWRGGRLVDRRFGWTILVPKAMWVGHFQSTGMDTNDGVRISNFAPSLGDSGGTSPPVGWLRRMPADGVAVQIWFGERFPEAPPLQDARLPLGRHSFRRAKAWPYVGGRPAPLYRSFFADGFPFFAAIWFGPHAPRADRQAMWRMVRSLHFPTLREGTIWQHRYYVLPRASRYPTGTVTLFSASSLRHDGSSFGKPRGFFLIHAPRAFYAIKQTFYDPQTSSNSCAIAFDRRAFQFFCPGTGLRWNRVGNPVGAHAAEKPHLSLSPATVAQDGHILFSPFFGDVLRIDLKGSPWS